MNSLFFLFFRSMCAYFPSSLSFVWKLFSLSHSSLRLLTRFEIHFAERRRRRHETWQVFAKLTSARAPGKRQHRETSTRCPVRLIKVEIEKKRNTQQQSSESRMWRKTNFRVLWLKNFSLWWGCRADLKLKLHFFCLIWERMWMVH